MFGRGGLASLAGMHKETKESDYNLPMMWAAALLVLGLLSLGLVWLSLLFVGRWIGPALAALATVGLVARVFVYFDERAMLPAGLVGVALMLAEWWGAWPNVYWGCLDSPSFCWYRADGAFVGRPMSGAIESLRLLFGFGVLAAWALPLLYVYGRGMREIAWPGLSDAEVRPSEMPKRSRNPFSDGRDWLDESEPEVVAPAARVVTIDHLVEKAGSQLAAGKTSATPEQWEALLRHAMTDGSFSGNGIATVDGFSKTPAREFAKTIPAELLQTDAHGKLTATQEFIDLMARCAEADNWQEAEEELA